MSYKKVVLVLLFLLNSLTNHAIDYADYNKEIRDILDTTVNQKYAQGAIIIRIKYDSTTHLIEEVYFTTKDKSLSKFLESRNKDLFQAFRSNKIVNDSTFSRERNFYYLEYFFHKSNRFISTTKPYYETQDSEIQNDKLILKLNKKEIKSIESFRKRNKISFEYRFPLLVYYILGQDGKVITAWIADNRYYHFFPDSFWEKVKNNAHNQIFKSTSEYTYHKSALIIK
jgi:hypothetical protein